MASMRFFDDNTRSWWTPATGGANVPALNDLLAPHGVALGDGVLAGAVTLAGEGGKERGEGRGERRGESGAAECRGGGKGRGGRAWW